MASIQMPMMVIPNKPFCNIWSFNDKLLTSKSSSSCFASSTNDHTVSSAIQSTQSTVPPCDCRLPIIVRRSGNYKPTTWNFEFVQSLNTEYLGERYTKQAAELKMQLKTMLESKQERVDQLEFIDDLQKLGISNHFECEIKQILTRIYEQWHLKNANNVTNQGNMYTEALQFRLLRQHGFKVCQEIFDCFKNEKGTFKSSIENDTEGLLQLYEASYLSTQGENTLELAREFATTFLQRNLDDQRYTIDQSLKTMIYYALEQPLHWRTQRPNARLFINVYETRPDMNPIVLQFAKLDFNILQATHQDELKQASRWWKGTGLAEKLPFARDRLVECYFWTIGGLLFEPQYRYSRIMVTKANAFITIIDDIYDVYGTLDELLLFTDVIERWAIEEMDQLPDYMQVCLLALNNFTNEIAYNVLKDQGFNIVPYLRKSWQDLCNAYLQEAKWYYESYTPGVKEYINHGWISSSAPVILAHAFFLVSNPLEKNVVESLYKYHDLIQWSGMLLRLADDLGTASEELKRGDVAKLLQCYMNETGVGENEARGYARYLIHETWKKINEERVKELTFPDIFVRSAVDLCRMAQYMYQHGDGHGIQNPQIKHRIRSLLFEPI